MQELSPYFINRSNPKVDPNVSFSAMASGRDEPNFREYCRIVAKHRRFIITLVICTLAFTSLVVFLMRPTYTATSTVLIEPRAPEVLGNTESETEASQLADDNYYNTEFKILQSRSLAAQVIRQLHLQNEPFLRTQEALGLTFPAKKAFSKAPIITDEDPDAGTRGVSSAIIDAYLKHLTIHPDPGTRLVTVAFDTPDPALSARIVNAHVQAYIARGTELHAEASENAVKYLRIKLTELEAQVEKSEAALNAYRRQRGIVTDSSDDSNKVAMDRIVDLNKALTEAETQRITLDAENHLISTRNYQALPAITGDTVIQNLRQQQARIQADYASLADQYKPNYPPLAELGAKLKETQVRLNQELHRVATGIGLSYQAAVEREKELNNKIDQEKIRALALNDASLRDAILSRAVETNRKLYKNVLERMTQMGMAAGVSASNVSVVDNATAPLEPSSPKKLLTLTSCGALALLIGISFACFRERFDDSFKDPAEIEHSVGVPRLALVPDFRTLSRLTNGQTNHLLSRFTSAEGKTGNVMIIANHDDSFSAATEAYRALRFNLLLSRAGQPPKIILITSGTPNEGKTVTAINTAVAFAQMGSKVLLIDADLRSSQCHKLLNIVNDAGLTDILTGQRLPDELARPTSITGLTCITSGSTPPNPGMLLSSSAMRDLLFRLKYSYDCILIDSAPVMPVTDTLHLMTVVDGVVLVVGPRVPKKRVKDVCARLRQAHAPLFGIVQNQVDITTHRNAGDYYYPRYHKPQVMNDASKDVALERQLLSGAVATAQGIFRLIFKDPR